MTDTPATAPATVTPTDNGPYRLSGDFTVTDADGGTFPTPPGKDVMLCRCGQSASKPFCDGTHSKVGFEAVNRASQD